jgi:hypothetical protein
MEGTNMADPNSNGGMFPGLQTIVTVLQNCVTGIGALNQTLQSIFPRTGQTSTTATGGAITPPALVVGYVTVTLPNGPSVKIPYYGL